MKYALRNGAIHKARAEEVYDLIEPGTISMVHSDGPYGLGKADWDRVKDLAAWYRPHIAAWSRLCKPSATVYLWGTAEGWASLHAEMLAAGWTFRCLITWDKGISFLHSMHCDLGALRGWKDVTEVCGCYQREGYDLKHLEENHIRVWLCAESKRAGLTQEALKKAINELGGKGNMITKHSFARSQWCMPTFEQWCFLHKAWNLHGKPEGRPYLQKQSSDLYPEYDALRSEYDALRCPFEHPKSITNVWSYPALTSRERLKGSDCLTLHPCQKPLLFAERMVQASTRPEDIVLEPFGGTCRIAVAIEKMAIEDPSKARKYICVEQDLDGRNYVDAVLGVLRAQHGVIGEPET